jgi:hypothetical protein
MTQGTSLPLALARLILLAPLLGIGSGCTRHLPPPRPPNAVEPPSANTAQEQADVPQAQAQASRSRVVVQTDVPARVEAAVEVEATHSVRQWRRRPAVLPAEIAWVRLCDRTPCTIELPRGDHRLRFTGVNDDSRTSQTFITVARPVESITHTLGQDRSSTTGTIVGGFLFVLGLTALVLPYGIDMDVPRSTSDVVFGASVAAMFSGVTLMTFDPAIKQEGSTSQWSRPAPEAASAGMPPGVQGATRGATVRVKF